MYHDDTTIPTQCRYENTDVVEKIILPYCFIKFVVIIDKKLSEDNTYEFDATVHSFNDSSEKDGSFMYRYGGLLDAECK